jgi:cytochrome c
MKRYVSVCFILMLAFQLSAGLSFADRAEDCQNLVAKAVDFMKENGPEYSFKVFSASKGPFIDRELYIFACSLDNVMLAHPYRTELIGKNVNEFEDVKGNLLFQEFKKVAQNGGKGWVNYWWWRPGEKDPAPKASFVMKVPGENLYVGAGYYTTEAHASR